MWRQRRRFRKRACSFVEKESGDQRRHSRPMCVIGATFPGITFVTVWVAFETSLIAIVVLPLRSAHSKRMEEELFPTMDLLASRLLASRMLAARSLWSSNRRVWPHWRCNAPFAGALSSKQRLSSAVSPPSATLAFESFFSGKRSVLSARAPAKRQQSCSAETPVCRKGLTRT
jgi:hypothetical protein